jgi:hypothetical protein
MFAEIVIRGNRTIITVLVGAEGGTLVKFEVLEMQ